MDERCKDCKLDMPLALLKQDVSVMGTGLSKVVSDIDYLAKGCNENKINVKELQATVLAYTSHSLERHDKLNGALEKMVSKLDTHMIEEEVELKEQKEEFKSTLKSSLEPIRDSLEQLHNRWWSIVIYALTALGMGMVGILLYVWENRGGL